MLVVFLRSEAVVMPGDMLFLEAGKLQAQCPLSDCTSWASAGPANCTIGTPTQRTVPTVSISAPAQISTCGSYTLDVTSSVGSGGRSWSRIQVDVLSVVNSTRINNFFATEYEVFPPTPLPSEYLAAGPAQYVFVVTLCNFLGACGRGFTSLTVVDKMIPTVSIFGANVLTSTRSSSVRLSADAYVPSCSDRAVRSGLNSQWSLYTYSASNLVPATTVDVEFSSQYSFELSPFSLLANTRYRIEIQVNRSSVAYTAVAHIEVAVGQGALVAVISGGSRRVVRAHSTFDIDASQSYDEDLSTSERSASILPLSFSWSCLQVEPVLTVQCGVQLPSINSNWIISTVAYMGSMGSTSVVTVAVFDSTRTAEAKVDIVVGSTGAPLVTLESQYSRSLVSPSDELVLSATVTYSSELSVAWSCDYSALQLADVSMTPVMTRLFSPNRNQSTLTVNLVLSPNTLPAWSALTFSLTAQSIGAAAETLALIEIVVNGPPLPG